MNHGEIVSFLWSVADLIRDTFKRGKYQDVILPLTVLRRLDGVLAGTKERVLKRQAELKGKGLGDLDAQLRRASGFAFYNTSSRYDFDKLLGDAPHLAANTGREAPPGPGIVWPPRREPVAARSGFADRRGRIDPVLGGELLVAGGRQLQYEMFYSAAQPVVNRRLYRANDWRAATARVDRLLAEYRRR